MLNVLKIVLTFVILCSVPVSYVLASDMGNGENQAVILMYHHFGVEKYPSTNIRLEQFEAHLEHLDKAKYLIWPLAKVAEHIQLNKPFPARVVAITIDDAYQSVYSEAYPRLKKKGWPFTVFVATDGVDRHFRSYMSWSQIREMHENGVTFANHSASHDYLIRLKQGENHEQWKKRISEDIQRSQTRLKAELGEAPMLFAYPYGEYNTFLANIVADMGYIAFGQHSGAARIGADTRALPRFPIAEKFAAIDEFKQKVASMAFPIKNQSPWEPLLFNDPTLSDVLINNPPLLEITLDNSDAELKQLNCFVSEQGHVEIKWLNQKEQHFSIQAEEPLPAGRSRYNCTAPSPQKGRFYWYSHLWINPSTNGKPSNQ